MTRWITAALLLAVACGGREAGRYGSVDGMLDALQDGGSRCSAARAEPGGKLIQKAAACSIDGHRVRVSLFGKRAARRDWLALARAFDGVHVVGPNWVITAPNHSAARRVQEAIGGEID
jgi:hypothetical protein